MATVLKTLLGETVALTRFLFFGLLPIGSLLAGPALGADWRGALLDGFDLGGVAFLASSVALLRADPARMRANAAGPMCRERRNPTTAT